MFIKPIEIDIKVPYKLTKPHPLIERAKRAFEEIIPDKYGCCNLKYFGEVALRSTPKHCDRGLRIMNTILKILEKLDHKIEVIKEYREYRTYAHIAFFIALAMNFFSYWNSDKIVLKIYRAQPLDPAQHSGIINMIEELARKAEIPTPKAYIMNNPQPNAFATGRNPANGAVAVTTGIIDLLSENELRGVIAHEIAHIKNRDTLIMTVTSTIAGALSMLANFAMFFGGRRERGGNPFAVILVSILAPLGAMLVQMAISRTREYSADKTGAEISEDPESLASALKKIQGYASRIDNNVAENNPATAHLFIINPLHTRKVDSLFSTHPATENRISALMDMSSKAGLSDKNNLEKVNYKKGSFDF